MWQVTNANGTMKRLLGIHCSFRRRPAEENRRRPAEEKLGSVVQPDKEISTPNIF